MLPAYLTVVPAYGRDYKSKKAVLEDWKAGKDFQISCIASEDDGRYVSISEAENLKKDGVKALNFRFKGMTNIAVLKL